MQGSHGIIATVLIASSAVLLSGCPKHGDDEPEFSVTATPASVEAFVGDRFGIAINSTHLDAALDGIAMLIAPPAGILGPVAAGDIAFLPDLAPNYLFMSSGPPVEYHFGPHASGAYDISSGAYRQVVMFECVAEGEGDIDIEARWKEYMVIQDRVRATSVHVLCKPKPCVEDQISDYIDSICSAVVSFTGSWLDIICFEAWKKHLLDALAAEKEYGASSRNACGSTEGGRRVVCPTGVLDMPEGEVVMVETKLAAPVPQTDPDHSYIYAVVFDSDDDPANGWQFVPPYDCDYFMGADRWYQCIYDHVTDQWIVTVTQVDSSQHTTQVSSTARCVIEDDTVVWHISKSDFPGVSIPLRVSAFGHDGSFGASDRGGDVSGVDPTVDLMAFW